MVDMQPDLIVEDIIIYYTSGWKFEMLFALSKFHHLNAQIIED